MKRALARAAGRRRAGIGPETCAWMDRDMRSFADAKRPPERVPSAAVIVLDAGGRPEAGPKMPGLAPADTSSGPGIGS